MSPTPSGRSGPGRREGFGNTHENGSRESRSVYATERQETRVVCTPRDSETGKKDVGPAGRESTDSPIRGVETV